MKIALCGCGWLGQPLAAQLTARGHNIVASKRSADGVSHLNSLGYTAVQYALGDDLQDAALQPLLNCDVLMLNIPPGRKHFEPEQYLGNMKTLISAARQSGTKKLLFISTSAVYGETSRVVYEYSPTLPETASAKVHVALETYAQKVFGKDAGVLRLSGLIGDHRHPANTLSGRQLDKGHKVVNLIHQSDVIAAIIALIENDKFGHVLHLAAHDHPSRQDYYTWACQQLGLPLPVFTQAPCPPGKRVNADFTLDTLGITLRYPSPYDMLQLPVKRNA